MKIRCRRCGAVLGGLRKYVPLSEGGICKKCFEELGYDYNDKEDFAGKSYEQIACGYNAYIKRQQVKVARDFGFQLAHYGEEREVDATDKEMEMFDILSGMVNNSELRLTRKSKDYVSAVIGDFDVARMKFTDRAKWIIFPYAEPKAQKHHIQSPSDILELKDLLDKNLERKEKFK